MFVVLLFELFYRFENFLDAEKSFKERKTKRCGQLVRLLFTLSHFNISGLMKQIAPVSSYLFVNGYFLSFKRIVSKKVSF